MRPMIDVTITECPRTSSHGGADCAQSEWDAHVHWDAFADPHGHPKRADSHKEDKEAKDRLPRKSQHYK